MFAAARTGWLPIGGISSLAGDGLVDRLRHMVVPVLALALPIGAMFERMQAQAMRRSVVAAVRDRDAGARCAAPAPVWRDALKVGLRPIASVYGLVVGSLLSGSFAVEIVTAVARAWDG